MFSLLNSFLIFTAIYFSLAFLSLVPEKGQTELFISSGFSFVFFVSVFFLWGQNQAKRICLSLTENVFLISTLIALGQKIGLERVLILKVHYQVKQAQWNVEINRKARGVSCHLFLVTGKLSEPRKAIKTSLCLSIKF